MKPESTDRSLPEDGNLDDHPKEACGVVGVFAPGEDVSRLTYFALLALQHRGQESAGIAVSDGKIWVVKEMGLVAQVFDVPTLSTLTGDLSIGHVRYSTTGSSNWENSQPVLREQEGREGLSVALGHNGNLVNTLELVSELDAKSGQPPAVRTASTDSDIIAEMVVRSGKPTVEEAILDTLPRLQGAFSLVMMDESKIYGARDPHGFRPLVLGALPGGGFILTSETCALDIVGARLIREIEPGELVTIDSDGVHPHRYAEPKPSLCMIEYVYFARPDSTLYGKSVYKARYEMGRRLAQEAPVDADLVMPVPDSGRGAAQGYAAGSGIPYGEGLVANRYVGRTFIQPTQSIRQQGVRTKLNPISEVISGQRLVVVEDTIVRGTTTGQIVQMLRDSGAREVHMRVSSPPIKWPCFYGIDIGDPDQLVAASKSVEEIRQHIGADSLAYLSHAAMVASTEVEADMFCTACFSAHYPVPVPENTAFNKSMLEEKI